MHRKIFWDRVGPSAAITALLIKKTIGIGYTKFDADAVLLNSSETRWHKDQDTGMISRERQDRPVADPSSSWANGNRAFNA